MSTSTTNRKGSSQDAALIEYLSALLDDEVGDFERKRVLDELERDDFLAQKLANYALISETLHSEESACFAGPDFLQGVRRQLESEPAYSSQTLYANTSGSSGSSLERKPATQKQNTENSGLFGRWLRPVGGFAMAASVAAVAVVGFQYYWGQSGLSNSSRLTSLSITDTDNDAAKIVSNTPNQSELTQKQVDKAVLASAESLPSIQKNILRQEETVVNSATASPQGNVLSDPFYRQADMKTRALLKRYVDSHMKYASTNAFVPSVRVIAYSDY